MLKLHDDDLKMLMSFRFGAMVSLALIALIGLTSVAARLLGYHATAEALLILVWLPGVAFVAFAALSALGVVIVMLNSGRNPKA